MTPDQLKAYVDAALQSTDKWIFVCFIVSPLLSLLVVYLNSYTSEKGKNTATKEDIGNITKEIKSAEEGFNARLESLKTDLSLRGYFNQRRYESEMAILQKVWQKLADFRIEAAEMKKMVTALKQTPDAPLNPEQEAVFARFDDAVVAFRDEFWRTKPFMPAVIWSELNAVHNLLVDHLFVTYYRAHDAESLRRASDQEKQIADITEKVCRAMRKRLEHFDFPESYLGIQEATSLPEAQ